MNDVMRVDRSRAIAALCAVALLCSLPACGAGDDSGGDRQDGASGKHDGGGGTGGKSGSDAGTGKNDCEEEDGGPGRGCEDGFVCVDGACEAGYCGDGVELGKEECDDGNVAGGDGCDPGCKIEKKGCGDGVAASDEECDDGNTYDGDACSNACTNNECGNARIDQDEECDDGNRIDDDECSNDCLEVRCRNGRMDPGEECDDGNRINDDGCTNACKIELCGNGKAEGKEECDDANQVDDDTCSKKCTKNDCGNSRVDPGEVCDGFGCAPDCMSKAVDMCRPCEEEQCSNYADFFDLVAGCLEGHPNADLVPEAASPSFDSPMFKQQCVDAVMCAREHDCGYDDPQRLVVTCYCGSADNDTCNDSGPADDAPCVMEWQAATHGATNTEILLNLTDFAFPSGWAYNLLRCDVESCSDVCVP